MRIVAIAAGQLTLTDGMVGRLPHLRPHVLVAGQAGLGLGLGLELVVFRFEGMHAVAVRARDVAPLVHAALPEELLSPVVAALADGGLLFFGELRDARPQRRVVRVFGVRRSRPMAALASLRRLPREDLLAMGRR